MRKITAIYICIYIYCREKNKIKILSFFLRHDFLNLCRAGTISTSLSSPCVIFNNLTNEDEYTYKSSVTKSIVRKVRLAHRRKSMVRALSLFVYDSHGTGLTEYYCKSVLHLLKRTWNMRLSRCSTDLQ